MHGLNDHLHLKTVCWMWWNAFMLEFFVINLGRNNHKWALSYTRLRTPCLDGWWVKRCDRSVHQNYKKKEKKNLCFCISPPPIDIEPRSFCFICWGSDISVSAISADIQIQQKETEVHLPAFKNDIPSLLPQGYYRTSENHTVICVVWSTLRPNILYKVLIRLSNSVWNQFFGSVIRWGGAASRDFG